MRIQDTILKKYFSDKTRLADIFNYYCFNGQEEIRADEIETKDSVENIVISGKDNKHYSVNRIRDVLATAERDRTILLLLGIENQSAIHYGMPVRNLLYDALTYANQVEELTKENRSKEEAFASQAEFLSGIAKGQKLKPVITLVIYYGKEPWDGPKSLSDMLDMDGIPEQLQPYIQSKYKLNLIEVRKISDYEKFHSDIQQVFQLLSCDEDKLQMKQMIEGDEKYKYLPYDAATAIGVLTSSREIMDYADREREGKVDMCKAIQDMIMDGREEGLQEGIQKGRKEGIQIFILDNMEENIPRERIYEKLQRRFGLTSQIAEQYMEAYYMA